MVFTKHILFDIHQNQSQIFICTLIFNSYFKPCIILKFNILYLRIASRNVCNVSIYVFFVMHLPEDGRISGLNMQEIYGFYNIISYT
jgi:hypothetical protein